jgi:putative transcriptional regulator
MVFIGVEILNLRRRINNGKINKNNIRFFLGYTGWEENQLQLEMISNSWIVAANSYKNKIIGKSSAQFWKEQILELGGDYILVKCT